MLGFKTRKLSCVTRSGRTVPEENCQNLPSQPTKQRRCKGNRCTKWKTGSWGQRPRAVVCRDQNKEEVHEMYCMEEARPPYSESCNTHACEFLWVTGEWAECSVSCGQGYHRRLVSCSEVHAGNDGSYEYGRQASSSCPGTPPESYMPCSVGPCPPALEWRAGIWGPCSVSCGDGVMERMVQCVSAESPNSDKCPPETRPQAREVCSKPACKWPKTSYTATCL
ncbi:A disintegrin and metalloproteinase with thrombospondin motifs 9-like [Aplochiton taeniatus]